MSARFHHVLFIAFGAITAMTLIVLTMKFSLSNWWLILGFPLVGFSSKVIFQYLIPVRCPDCAAFLQCKVSVQGKHGTRDSNTTVGISYSCNQCTQELRSCLNLTGGFAGFFVGGAFELGIVSVENQAFAAISDLSHSGWHVPSRWSGTCHPEWIPIFLSFSVPLCGLCGKNQERRKHQPAARTISPFEKQDNQR